jgi:hypothetical protein
MIGHEQPFWPALKPETIERKAQGDTPLLETGALRDSISHVVYPEHGYGDVGSTSKIAVYQELGTKHIPPALIHWQCRARARA